ncbi:hypothetical protein K438DRAFT_1801940 [Mycena galopus ATCC 62051]|nr:hypothetical protein K438DRAFT_1801940 [Mycena galopus ATCC 62051]
MPPSFTPFILTYFPLYIVPHRTSPHSFLPPLLLVLTLTTTFAGLKTAIAFWALLPPHGTTGSALCTSMPQGRGYGVRAGKR